MGPVCACGCGEYLPEGSTRNYKRGHKSRISAEGGWGTTEPEKADGFFDGTDSLSLFTIDHAAESTPNDPEPADLDGNAAKPYSPPIKITASVRKDIEGKLAFMLGMTANLVQISDATCGGALMEQTPAIAHKLTPILCQSPGVVKWFKSGTNFLMYVDFIMALAPVITTVYTHHMVKSNPQVPDAVPYTQEFYGVS